MNSSNRSSNRSNNCRLDGNKADDKAPEAPEVLEAPEAHKEQSNAQCCPQCCSHFSPCSQPKASGTPIVSLSDIIMALEMTNDESCAYLDTKTGEIKWQFDFDPSLSDISSEELEADELDGLDEADKTDKADEAGEAGEAGEADKADETDKADEADEECGNRKRYLLLPDRFEINEYHMIEAFAYNHADYSGGRLVRAIQGRGAFRRFRETVARLGLLDEWYEFRDNCYRERAVSWCRGHNLRVFSETNDQKCVTSITK